jgi:hypothetical protein
VPLMSRVADPVRPRCHKSFVVWSGLTFIPMQNELAKALKINPHQPPNRNEGCRADWAALDTLAVSRYCLHVSALPVVQQSYGAAMTGT